MSQRRQRRSDQLSTVAAAPRRTPRPADRRAEIIAAAIRVIARDGIRACTVSALEHETRFARGHFSYHFESKEEIIALAFATVGSDWATAQVNATTGDAVAERVERRVRAAVEWARDRPEYFRCLMNFRVEMMRDPTRFPRAAEIRGQFWDFTAQMLAEGAAAGEFHLREDAATEARIVFAMVDGMLLHAAMDTTFCPAELLVEHVWAVIAARLGVASRTGSGAG